MYGKIVNDKIEYAPSVFTTDDGRKIINFNKNVSIMKKYGFLEIENIVPMYDTETEEVVVLGYEVEVDKIVVKYNIIEKTIVPTLEERVSNIEVLLNAQASLFDEEINK